MPVGVNHGGEGGYFKVQREEKVYKCVYVWVCVLSHHALGDVFSFTGTGAIDKMEDIMESCKQHSMLI